MAGFATLSLLIGSVMMTDVVSGVRVGFVTLIPLALGLAGAFLFMGRLALKAQKLPAATGTQTMIGQHTLTLTPVAPDAPGQVKVRGEIWRVLSRVPLPSGERVRIIGMNGLTLMVEPDEVSRHEGADEWRD